MNGTATSVGGVNVPDTMTCEKACNGQCCVGGYVKTFDLTSIPYNLDAEVFRGACDGLTALFVVMMRLVWVLMHALTQI